MREAPPIQVRVTRFGVWRVALLSVPIGCLAGLWPWWLSRSHGSTTWSAVVVFVSSIAAIAVVVRLWTDNRAFELRWDSERWGVSIDEPDLRAHRSPVDAFRHAHFPVFLQGELMVVMDLGSWMLLRFDRPLFEPNLAAAAASTDVNSHPQWLGIRPKTTRLWLPLQRAGLERQWHGLRCALYSRASPDLDSSRSLIPQDPA
ncbi:MAG: hypothetical protein JWQ11_2434 [Rhizobacter sp.]|nr:hypothetical protein [Rhizobacter sp.]